MLLKHFRTPEPRTMAQHELESARRELLLALSTKEHAQSVVSFNEARISRLEKYLASTAQPTV